MSEADSAVPDAPVAPQTGALKKAAGGAFWETAGFGTSQVVRLGSNLVLTRLLAPEAFGLMAMVSLVSYSLAMISDVGITQAVISSADGDDDDYLNTAWTLQVIQGVGLMVAMWIATYPAAILLKEPRLLWILPTASLATGLHGLVSSRVFTLRRRVHVMPLIRLELIVQALAVPVNVIGAYYGFGVIALLGGMIFSAIVHVVATHFLPGTDHRDRLHLDREHMGAILRFGRWIFMSSALTVVANRSDQGLMQRLLGAAQVGLYNVALGFAEMPEALANRVTHSVLYPILAEAHNKTPAEFGKVYYRLRFYYDAIGQTAVGGLAAMASWVINFLYDDRYAGAGPMLQVIAARTSVSLVATACETCFFAIGLSSFGFRRNVVVSIAMVSAMPVGYHYGGAAGLLWGTVAARASALLLLWPAARPRGFFKLHRELLAPAFLAFGYGLGTVFTWVLPDF